MLNAFLKLGRNTKYRLAEAGRPSKRVQRRQRGMYSTKPLRPFIKRQLHQRWQAFASSHWLTTPPSSVPWTPLAIRSLQPQLSLRWATPTRVHCLQRAPRTASHSTPAPGRREFSGFNEQQQRVQRDGQAQQQLVRGSHPAAPQAQNTSCFLSECHPASRSERFSSSQLSFFHFSSGHSSSELLINK